MRSTSRSRSPPSSAPHADHHPLRRHGHRRGGRKHIARVPFDALTGMKAFVVANALVWPTSVHAEIISPLVQQLPKLWELFHNFGMTTLELNPIRMRPDRRGRLTRWPATSSAVSTATMRAGTASTCLPNCSPPTIPTSSRRSTSCAPPGPERRLRDQRQGHHPRPDLRRRRQLAGHRMLGDDAIISSDFGGNRPTKR